MSGFPEKMELVGAPFSSIAGKPPTIIVIYDRRIRKSPKSAIPDFIFNPLFQCNLDSNRSNPPGDRRL